ncbi:hypothetical protein SAMN06298216_1646 [Spirosomataceae bacterium TFI 002]|nr:hypothetical protein SAMN06298216_1646 [Spirosomataceae bacterium TFI 002]
MKNKKQSQIAKEMRLWQIEKLLFQNEQKRLSNELHDNIMPLLIVVRRRLEMNIEEKEKDIQYLNDIISKLRELTLDLGTTPRSRNDLENAINQLLAVDNQIAKNLSFEWNEAELNEDFKTVAYKVLAELFANTLKHSNCTSINIEFTKDLKLIYSDNSKKLNELYEFGIGNINQYVNKNGGDLHLNFTTKTVTIITVNFNLKG